MRKAEAAMEKVAVRHLSSRASMVLSDETDLEGRLAMTYSYHFSVYDQLYCSFIFCSLRMVSW